jgi:hypothetical protein
VADFGHGNRKSKPAIRETVFLVKFTDLRVTLLSQLKRSVCNLFQVIFDLFLINETNEAALCGAMTFSIMTLSITTISIKGLFETLSKNEIQHK